MSKTNRQLTFAIWVLVFSGAAVSWSQFLWPPLDRYRHSKTPDLLKIVGELLNPVSTMYPFPGGGWLFLLTTFALLLIVLAGFRSILAYIDRSMVGISVLETKMELVLDNADGSLATVRRTQSFHANRYGISAYSLVYKPDSPTGRIDTASLGLWSSISDKNITKELLRRGTDRFADVKEIYTRELPVNWFATFLPNGWVHRLHSWGAFKGTVVVRTGEVRYIDEYTGQEAIISLNASMRPVSNVHLKVTFPEGAEPAPGDIKGFLLRETAVQDVDLRPSTANGTRSYEAHMEQLYQATLQIQWKNRPGGAP